MTNVFSKKRIIEAPDIELSEPLQFNTAIVSDGLELMAKLPNNTIPAVFFDPQYRGILDKMSYGNEGKSREKQRAALKQMETTVIRQFVLSIDSLLIPSGYLFLWIDKFHLCDNIDTWINETDLSIVDLLVWNKDRMGMGYRTRRTSEYCLILQKKPSKAKGHWILHNIRDVWTEKIEKRIHPHQKPLQLQKQLILAVTNPNDIVLDPAAGSYSVMQACVETQRRFIGCDIESKD